MEDSWRKTLIAIEAGRELVEEWVKSGGGGGSRQRLGGGTGVGHNRTLPLRTT